jgi:hypothetical protein
VALPDGGRKESQSDRLVHGAVYRANSVSRMRRITAHAEAFGLAALTDYSQATTKHQGYVSSSS